MERQPLVGTWGRVWLDGEEIAKVQSITEFNQLRPPLPTITKIILRAQMFNV